MEVQGFTCKGIELKLTFTTIVNEENYKRTHAGLLTLCLTVVSLRS